MKISYRKFALWTFVFSIFYHAAWMYLAQIAVGEMRLIAGVHITLLFILPVVLLLCAPIWLNMWNFNEFKNELFLTLTILIVPGVALQLIEFFACQLQGECF